MPSYKGFASKARGSCTWCNETPEGEVPLGEWEWGCRCQQQELMRTGKSWVAAASHRQAVLLLPGSAQGWKEACR